jgi:hypothetical protein
VVSPGSCALWRSSVAEGLNQGSFVG